MDDEMQAECLRARLIVAGVAFRMLDGAWARCWVEDCRRIIRERAYRLLALAEVQDA